MKVRHVRRKAAWFVSNREQIKLDPSWQRGKVWSARLQSLLMDSILRAYDIPKIYLWKRPDGGAHTYEVVDGQQRIVAIQSFFDGQVALPEHASGPKGMDLSGCTVDDLSTSVRKKLEAYSFNVVLIDQSIPVGSVSQMFSRLQLGTRLNAAELRNAIQTPLRAAIDAVARNHSFFETSRIRATRYARQDFLAHLFTAIYHDGKVDLKAPQLKEDYEKVETDEITDIVQRVEDVLDILAQVNDAAGRRITQKWVFVDLGHWLFRRLTGGHTIDVNALAVAYKKFDETRLEYNRQPEALLKRQKIPNAQAIFKYIQSFKVSGGEKGNLAIRRRSVEQILKGIAT